MRGDHSRETPHQVVGGRRLLRTWRQRVNPEKCGRSGTRTPL
jgi:hypothetical protein